MPYTKAQCKIFAVKASKGQQVPSDWKKHCKKNKKRPAKKKGK